MVAPRGPAFDPRPSGLIAFLLLLTWSNFAWAAEIHEAVKNHDLAKVRTLIKNNPDLVFAKDEDGFTPLHLAAANGYKEMAKFLLTSKSDVSSKDNSGSTPYTRRQQRRRRMLTCWRC